MVTAARGWPIVVTLAACAAIGAPARAGKLELTPGLGGVPDLGATHCELFNRMYPNGPSGLRQATLYWIEGFVYAKTSRTMDAFLAGRPGSEQWTFTTLTDHVVNFCRANPDAQVTAAVEDLWKTLNEMPDAARTP